ncbi:MAG: hypothetical protein FJ272_21055, partial [Planctomycetes bacterium]|nr:hypothetical protein [Planctomycetota bacterium]
MKPLLLPCLILASFSAAAALGQSPAADIAGLNLKIDDEGGFRVTYKGVVVIPRGSFYLADKDWKSVFPGRGARAFKVSSTPTAGGQTIRLATAPQEFVDATLEATVEPRRLTFDLRYKTKPNTSAHFAVCDIFLSKEMFSGSAFRAQATDAAPQEGVLDEKAFKGVTAPSVALKCLLGTVTLTMKAERVPAEAGAASAWTLRNVCDRPWGPEELRTFSLLNCFTGVPSAGLEQRLSFALTVEEAPDLDAKLYGSNLERGLSAFKQAYQKLGGSLAAIEGQLQALQPEAKVELLNEAILKLKRALRRVVVIPAPQEMTVTSELFAFASDAAIVASAADARASNLLRDELRE